MAFVSDGLVAFNGQWRAAERRQVIVGQGKVARLCGKLGHKTPAPRVVVKIKTLGTIRIQFVYVGFRHASVSGNLARQAKCLRIARCRHRRIA